MIKKVCCLWVCFFFVMALYVNAAQASEFAAWEPIRKVRVTWEATPNAVMYQLIVTRGQSLAKERIVTTKDEIYATGYELDTAVFDVEGENLHWSVRAMDVKGRPITGFSAPKSLLLGEINTKKPLATTQFGRIAFAKIYPVYSWIPYLKASEYEVQVFYEPSGDLSAAKLIKTDFVVGGDKFDYYDDGPYIKEGFYWWRVRAKNAAFKPISEWSEPERFQISHQGVDIAALGDSITHGGGAISSPPSSAMYDWESYAGAPVLNLGLSGNTVEHMVGRFNRDVLPFQPKILIVMGGINNIRAGDKAEQVIKGLNAIKFKCLINHITPVFVTVAPVNPVAMNEVSGIVAYPGWERELAKVNDWIKKQNYNVDITPELTDARGWLQPHLAADGLHPDVEGKKIIGEAIGKSLERNFKNSLLRKYYK